MIEKADSLLKRDNFKRNVRNIFLTSSGLSARVDRIRTPVDHGQHESFLN